MDDIVLNLAIGYAKRYGLSKITDKALEYAYETLGIEPDDEEYEGVGIYGMKNRFAPKNLMKTGARKFLSNAANKAITSGGSAGMTVPLIAASLGLAYARNPLRPGSMNYNPDLAGQIKDLNSKNMLNNRNQIISGPLKGKNLVSLFGTNDYADMLQNKTDWYEDRITSGKDYKTDGETGYRATKDAAIVNSGIGVNIDGVTMSGADYYGGQGDRDGGGGGDTESQTNSQAGVGGFADYAKGGIAGINRNRGQLGETLYG